MIFDDEGGRGSGPPLKKMTSFLNGPISYCLDDKVSERDDISQNKDSVRYGISQNIVWMTRFLRETISFRIEVSERYGISQNNSLVRRYHLSKM